MEPFLNPYTPGSGIRPPELVGRDRELQAIDTMIARARLHQPNRSLALTGLRGVGKTVLLNEMRRKASEADWFVVGFEAQPGADGKQRVLERLVRELTLAARSRSRVHKRLRAAFGTITSFTARLGITGIEIGVAATPGRADSGDLDIDLAELVVDLAESLRADGLAFGLFIDEMQDLSKELVGALLTAQHEAAQRDLPFYIIGAGLPNLPRVLAEVRSYAERQFAHFTIGALGAEDAKRALVEPAQRYGARFQPKALAILLDAARGYPYFIQEYGRAVWDIAAEPVFTVADAKDAVADAVRQLDVGFYRSRWERASPTERLFLAAMSPDAGQPSMSAEIAARLDRTSQSLGPVRAALIAKGLLYSPEYGQIAHTVPGMADYITRNHPDGV